MNRRHQESPTAAVLGRVGLPEPVRAMAGRRWDVITRPDAPSASPAYPHPRNARTKSCSTRNFSYRMTPFRFWPNSANRSLSRPRRVT